MFAVKTKIYGVSIINPALSPLMKLLIGQRQKSPNFSAFHWSPHGSLVSTGQYFITTRVVQLPTRTETSLIIDSSRSRTSHRIGPGKNTDNPHSPHAASKADTCPSYSCSTIE